MSRPTEDEIDRDLRLREIEALERIADALEAFWYKEQPDVKPATWVKARGVTIKPKSPLGENGG